MRSSFSRITYGGQLADFELSGQPRGEQQFVPELRDRYGDLISRYVRNRVDDTEAERIVGAVFVQAGHDPAAVGSNPLPWLISAARHQLVMSHLGQRAEAR